MTKDRSLTKEDRSKKHYDNIVKALPLEKNSLILVKRNTSLTKNRNVISLLAQSIGRSEFTGCVVCVVDDFNDLTVLHEDKARELGWCRIRETWLSRIIKSIMRELPRIKIERNKK